MPDIVVGVLFEIDSVTPMTQETITVVVEKVCEAVAQNENLALSEVSVAFVDNEAIRALNHEYRSLDEATDVLSFALLEGEEQDVEVADDEPQQLGDIIISWPRLCEQALDYGHSHTRELAFLTAHGMLHLLGYDHQNKDDEHTMFSLQEDILTSLGYTR